MRNISLFREIKPISEEAFSFTWMDQLSVICFVFLVFISTLILYINSYYWHFSVVSYFAPGVIGIFFVLFLSTLGCFYTKGKSSRLTQSLFYLTLYHVIVCVVMYATTAVQLTPFEPVDVHLLQMDRKLHYDTLFILDTLSNYPFLREKLSHAYNFIDLELLALPVFLILCRQFASIKQYFFLILATTIIGYSIYYFWPTAAPASVLQSIYFLKEQHNTGLKFYQIHQQIFPASDAGGLISMPSFHIIWAILCQHSAWRIRWLWYGLLPMNILVILSALFLGWHYLVDFFGSVLVIGLACAGAWLYKKMSQALRNNHSATISLLSE